MQDTFQFKYHQIPVPLIANVTYSSHGVNYNTQTNVGISGIAYFPILPSSNITVAVGNGLTNGNATETVTVIYYY